MFKSKNAVVITSLFAIAWLPINATAEITTNSGVTLSQTEIDAYSISVYPDGRNLPEGSGNALEGEKVYQNKCFMCHGPSGQKGVAPRLAGELGYQEYNPHPLIALTVGAWPYQTSIFDYIRRAMPHQAPKTLTTSEVYALTAYILNLNGVIGKADTLDRETLLQAEMPYRKGSYIAWDTDEGSKINGQEPEYKQP